MRLYLAGSLFSAAEREFNVRLKKLLAAKGFEVWLPQDHEPRKKSARAIFRKDVEGIEWCDVVVANMDGPDPDSGTCWECGYAYGKKPVILYRTDFRAGSEGKGFPPYNLMLAESANICILMPPFSSTEALAKRLIRELRAFKADHIARLRQTPPRAAFSR